MKVFIFGITGKVGSGLAQLLLEQHHEVYGLTRSKEKLASPKFYERVQFFEGDMRKPEPLYDIIPKVDAVFLFSPMPDENDNNMIRGVLDLLTLKKVNHVVWMSELGSGPYAENERWLIRWKSEEILRGSGITVTTLLPNYFMQNLFQLIPAMQSSDDLGIPATDAKFAMIDCHDISKAAYTIIANPDTFGGRRYELNGPESYSSEQAIALIGDTIGRTYKVKNIDLDTYTEALKNAGIPHWTLKHQIEILKIAETGFFDRPCSQLLEIIDEAKSLPKFIGEHKKAFSLDGTDSK